MGPIPTEEGRLLAKLASESRWRKWSSGVAGGGRGLKDSFGRRPLIEALLIFLLSFDLERFFVFVLSILKCFSRSWATVIIQRNVESSLGVTC